jgi:hypothetical protein
MCLQAGRDAVSRYSLRWQKLRLLKDSPTRIYSFRDIPWPMLQTPSQPADITKEHIENFFLDPLVHGKLDRQTQLKMMRGELMNWHPNKSDLTILPLVYEDQLPLVWEGVSQVISTLIQTFHSVTSSTY